VRLIDHQGNQLGVVSADDARRRADDVGLDLVEVSPNADPPVCKILDYGKLKYEMRKKEKGHGSKHSSQLKELRVRPAIDKHDLDYRMKQGRDWLAEGHKVSVVCVFRGRQMAHPELGRNVLKSVAEGLSDVAKVESFPRMLGNRMSMLIARK
jgi:translation initiation factor IF-3